MKQHILHVYEQLLNKSKEYIKVKGDIAAKHGRHPFINKA